MATFGIVHLPPGYRVAWVEDSMRLFDPQGELVATHPAGLNSLLAIDEEAWRHTWGRIDSEIRQELQQFQRGTRAVGELHRMRQYVRLLEILSEAAPETIAAGSSRRLIPLIPRRPIRAARWAIGAAAAAAAILLFLLAPAEQLAPPTVDAPVQRREALAPAPPPPAPPVAQTAPRVPPVTIVKRAQVARRVRPIAGYVMSYGRFTSLKAAQACAQRIRSKGYMANVDRVGSSFRVLGRIYTTRFDAERMAKNLQEINLPASVQPVGL
ncbi:MAG: hypothetical protein ACRDF5_03775 [bacterium]